MEAATAAVLFVGVGGQVEGQFRKAVLANYAELEKVVVDSVVRAPPLQRGGEKAQCSTSGGSSGSTVYEIAVLIGTNAEAPQTELGRTKGRLSEHFSTRHEAEVTAMLRPLPARGETP